MGWDFAVCSAHICPAPVSGSGWMYFSEFWQCEQGSFGPWDDLVVAVTSCSHLAS